MNLESFEKAFRPNIASSCAACKCGKIFYNSNGDWSWEDGELEKLHVDTEAKDLVCGVTFVQFENREYVADCTCWHKRAEAIMGFINSHAHQIAEYLSLEKTRVFEKSVNMPEVREHLKVVED